MYDLGLMDILGKILSVQLRCICSTIEVSLDETGTVRTRMRAAETKTYFSSLLLLPEIEGLAVRPRIDGSAELLVAFRG